MGRGDPKWQIVTGTLTARAAGAAKNAKKDAGQRRGSGLTSRRPAPEARGPANPLGLRLRCRRHDSSSGVCREAPPARRCRRTSPRDCAGACSRHHDSSPEARREAPPAQWCKRTSPPNGAGAWALQVELRPLPMQSGQARTCWARFAPSSCSLLKFVPNSTAPPHLGCERSVLTRRVPSDGPIPARRPEHKPPGLPAHRGSCARVVCTVLSKRRMGGWVENTQCPHDWRHVIALTPLTPQVDGWARGLGELCSWKVAFHLISPAMF